jgi:hypothetical protein
MEGLLVQTMNKEKEGATVLNVTRAKPMLKTASPAAFATT